MNKISVAILDDDKLIVSLLNDFLNQQSDMEVVLSTDISDSFLSLLKSSSKLPDVLVLDLKMKGTNGIDIASQLKSDYPNIHVLMMSSFYKSSFTGFMLKTGVSAFLPKGISPQMLVTIIRDVAQNGYFFLDEQIQMLRTQISSKSPKPVLDQKDELTEREIDVLKLICHQKTAKEIGETLFIAGRTVEGHKNNLFLKTGTKNIAGLVIYAVQNELINIDDISLNS